MCKFVHPKSVNVRFLPEKAQSNPVCVCVSITLDYWCTQGYFCLTAGNTNG